MALIWCEGFDDLDTADLNSLGGTEGRWDNFNVYQSGRGDIRTGTRTGNGKELYLHDNPYSMYFEKDIPGTPPGTIIVGMAIKLLGEVAQNNLLSFWDSNSNAWMIGLRVGANGTIIADRDQSGYGTNFVCASTRPLQRGVWHYLEIKILFSSTVGTMDFKIDGQSAGSFTGLNTNGSGTDTVGKVRFGQGDGTDHPCLAPAAIDDIYIADTSGSQNNDFLGPIEVATVMPTAEGSTNAWTPSTGTDNSALVDEIPTNEDTDYVSTATTTNQDLYDCANLSNTDSILGVQVSARVRNEGVGSETLKLLARSGTTTGASSAHGFDTTYVTVQSVFELNPDTSAAWTQTNFNAGEFGIELA